MVIVGKGWFVMSASSGFSIALSGVCVDRGGTRVLDGIDLALHARSRMALIGPNGVGKSTLLDVIAGELVPDDGAVACNPSDVRVGLIRQERERSSAETVLESLRRRTGVTAAQERFDEAVEALADAAPGSDRKYEVALDRWLAVNAGDFDARVGGVLDELGLERDLLDQTTDTLSGGQAARLGLATILASTFDVTLLDEPTNDLDADGLARLERWMDSYRGGLLLVSHDRAFLERTVDSVFELDIHTRRGAMFHGGWTAFIEERETRRRQAEERYGDYASTEQRLKQRAQQQREWVQQGVRSARKYPADGDKHRFNAGIAQTEQLASKAAATERALQRLEVVEKPWEGWDLRFTIAESPRSGTVVVESVDAMLSRGSFELGPVDLYLEWGERVVLAGPNGSGKSTLIEALLGRLQPVSGRVHLGPSVIVGELDQGRGRFDRFDDSLLSIFEQRTGLVGADARSVLAKFALNTEMVERPARTLSPGERTRAQLAEFQAAGVNLLVLDEPTNHLDMEAIEQLEVALESYQGTLLVVSHDRRFIQSISVDRTIDLSSFQT